MTDASDTSALGARLAILRDMRSEVLGSLVVIMSIGATGCSRDGAAPKPTDKRMAATPTKPAPLLEQYNDEKFGPGQVWNVSGKHTDARLVILRVERTRTGDVIVHGAVERDDSTKRIAHMPFDRAAIDGSVTELAGKAELPPYEEGYELWRDAFEKGEGGVFTVSIEEAIDFISESEPAKITISALPNGRVRLASGEEMSDEDFLSSFASSEQLARMRDSGRNIVIFVEQADGVSMERAYEVVAKIKIPGVQGATRLH